MSLQQAKLIDDKNDKRLLEFMNEIKQAIQNGSFEPPQQPNDSGSIQNSLISNLSNQTFNYIINWLKQQATTNEVSSFKHVQHSDLNFLSIFHG
jgi:hypothetical protein